MSHAREQAWHAWKAGLKKNWSLSERSFSERQLFSRQLTLSGGEALSPLVRLDYHCRISCYDRQQVPLVNEMHLSTRQFTLSGRQALSPLGTLRATRLPIQGASGQHHKQQLHLSTCIISTVLDNPPCTGRNSKAKWSFCSSKSFYLKQKWWRKKDKICL